MTNAYSKVLNVRALSARHNAAEAFQHRVRAHWAPLPGSLSQRQRAGQDEEGAGDYRREGDEIPVDSSSRRQRRVTDPGPSAHPLVLEAGDAPAARIPRPAGTVAQVAQASAPSAAPIITSASSSAGADGDEPKETTNDADQGATIGNNTITGGRPDESIDRTLGDAGLMHGGRVDQHMTDATHNNNNSCSNNNNNNIGINNDGGYHQQPAVGPPLAPHVAHQAMCQLHHNFAYLQSQIRVMQQQMASFQQHRNSQQHSLLSADQMRHNLQQLDAFVAGLQRQLDYLEQQARLAEEAQTQQNCLYRDLDETNVYVSHLPQTITHEEFFEIMSRFGSVVSSRVLVGDRWQKKGVHGVAFARMSTREEAIAAIRAVNNLRLPGSTTVLRARLAFKTIRSVDDDDDPSDGSPQASEGDDAGAVRCPTTAFQQQQQQQQMPPAAGPYYPPAAMPAAPTAGGYVYGPGPAMPAAVAGAYVPAAATAYWAAPGYPANLYGPPRPATPQHFYPQARSYYYPGNYGYGQNPWMAPHPQQYHPQQQQSNYMQSSVPGSQPHHPGTLGGLMLDSPCTAAAAAAVAAAAATTASLAQMNHAPMSHHQQAPRRNVGWNSQQQQQHHQPAYMQPGNGAYGFQYPNWMPSNGSYNFSRYYPLQAPWGNFGMPPLQSQMQPHQHQQEQQQQSSPRPRNPITISPAPLPQNSNQVSSERSETGSRSNNSNSATAVPISRVGNEGGGDGQHSTSLSAQDEEPLVDSNDRGDDTDEVDDSTESETAGDRFQAGGIERIQTYKYQGGGHDQPASGVLNSSQQLEHETMMLSSIRPPAVSMTRRVHGIQQQVQRGNDLLGGIADSTQNRHLATRHMPNTSDFPRAADPPVMNGTNDGMMVNNFNLRIVINSQGQEQQQQPHGSFIKTLHFAHGMEPPTELLQLNTAPAPKFSAAMISNSQRKAMQKAKDTLHSQHGLDSSSKDLIQGDDEKQTKECATCSISLKTAEVNAGIILPLSYTTPEANMSFVGVVWVSNCHFPASPLLLYRDRWPIIGVYYPEYKIYWGCLYDGTLTPGHPILTCPADQHHAGCAQLPITVPLSFFGDEEITNINAAQALGQQFYCC